MAVSAYMLDVFTGIEAQTTGASTEKRKKEKAPNFGSSAVFVLNFSHG